MEQTTMTQQPTAPQQQQPQSPAKRRRWLLPALGGVAAVVVAGAALGGGTDDPAAPASPQPVAEQPAGDSPAPAPAPEPEPAAPADPLTDNGWTASQIAVTTEYGYTSVEARLTNGGDSVQTAMFTLTAFDPAGAMVGSVTGSASDVEAGSTATVRFVAADELPGDPATWTWELQVDGAF